MHMSVIKLNISVGSQKMALLEILGATRVASRMSPSFSSGKKLWGGGKNFKHIKILRSRITKSNTELQKVIGLRNTIWSCGPTMCFHIWSARKRHCVTCYAFQSHVTGRENSNTILMNRGD